MPGVREGYYKVFTAYLENLFGYRNADLLEKYVHMRLPGATIYIDSRNVEIIVPADNMKSCFQLDMGMLREIRNYSWNVTHVDTIRILYQNTSDQGFVESIEHLVNLRSQSHTMNTAYRDGSSDTDSERIFI